MPGLLRLAWRVLPPLPSVLTVPLVDGVGAVVADLAWLGRGAGVRCLEENLAAVLPTASPTQRRRVSRAGMRSYLRYFTQVLTMPGWSRERLRASVRVEGLGPLAQALSERRGAVGFLGHLGSWDHIGAWAAAELAPVHTVAERLEPPALWDAFVAVRAALGIEVLPVTGGSFGRLVRVLRDGGFVPLLADRDMTGTGVPVALTGRRTRMASGPARLALATGAPLFPITVRYERRSRRSPSWWTLSPRWGIVATVHPPVGVPDVGAVASARTARDARDAAVRTMTQACADVLGDAIRAWPDQWHMLQPLAGAGVAGDGADADPTGASAGVRP